MSTEWLKSEKSHIPPTSVFHWLIRSKLMWFAAPSGLHTFRPIHQCVFFHYPCLKTDSDLWAFRAGESLQAPGSPQTQAPKWKQLSRLVRGWWPVSCPWRNSLNGQASWLIPVPVSGAAATGAHLEGGVASTVEKEIIFLGVRRQEKVAPKCWSPDCFWSLTRDETMRRTVLTCSLYPLQVIKTSHLLWNDVDSRCYLFIYFG